MENVLKTCAREFLHIDESRYEEEVFARDLDLFLLDSKARVTDETYTFNKMSFNFCYLKVRYIWLVLNLLVCLKHFSLCFNIIFKVFQVICK